jgi:hypothetical protein
VNGGGETHPYFLPIKLIIMEQFVFYVDQKVSGWFRQVHFVDADTYEEAQKIMVDTFKDNELASTFDSQSFMYDTVTEMEVGDNGGYPTLELFDNEDVKLIDNSNL